MDATMYIFINKGLGMSTGKAAAQASHAAVEAFRKSDPNLEFEWLLGGHYKKLVMEADDSDELANIGGYLADRGFDPEWIYDEGLTEFDGRMRHTALGVPIVDKDDPNVKVTFSTFRLYKDEPAPQVSQIITLHERELWDRIRALVRRIKDGAITTNNILHTDKPAPAPPFYSSEPDGVQVVDVTASTGPARRRLADGLAKLRSWG